MIPLVLILVIDIAYGGIPISYPNTKNSELGGKLLPYNLIDTNPSCYERGFCPMFPPGGRLSAFPNSEEKFQMILHNLFRQFGDYATDIKYGKYRWSANTNGGLTTYCRNCRYCGETDPEAMPLYWYSDANQAARFKQYDENACDQDWYDEPGQNAHSTCHWVLPEYGGGSHCDLFWGSCSLAYRAYFFCADRKRDRCWFETEGICGGNSCVTDGHCEPIFARKYDYQGSGFVEGMNGAATTYSRYTKEIWYLLPMGAHFDERTKVAEADRDQNGKYFTLMLEYFDANHTQTPLNCWSLYEGNYHQMDVILSEIGNLTHGFSRESYSVMFTSIHEPITRCRPYAFICKTSFNNFFRLPEEGDYYFGTEWIDWQYTDYSSFITDTMGYTCKENHYYHDGTQWIVNGGPELDRCDIWYYQDTEELRSGNYTHRTTCNGCEDLNQLDCWAECIYSDFAQGKCDCEEIEGPHYGNEWCEPDPTTDPTELPSNAPSEFPSAEPTEPPSESPISQSPSVSPTESPSETPSEWPSTGPSSVAPSEPPSAGPMEFIGVCCDCLVDTAPILSPSPTAGCASDSGCEAQVCDGDPDCCGVGWNAQCVSLAEDICFGTVDPTQTPTKAPVEQQPQPGNRTPRPTRRRRGSPVFH